MATIQNLRIAAAHDGTAELKVTLVYPNGGRAEITLDELAGHSLMTACGAKVLDDLIGQSWEKVKDALGVSFNRFQAAQGSAPLDPAPTDHSRRSTCST